MMETEQANNNDDIMSRRLKNRERQRRYRARKRLEADKQKAANTSAPVPVLVEMRVEHVEEPNKKPCNDANTSAASYPVPVDQTQVNGVSENYVTRVHCRRDWKNDARMAQKMKEQQNSLNAVAGADVSSCNGTEVESVTEELGSGGVHANNIIERSITPGRRRWKEDARNRSA